MIFTNPDILLGNQAQNGKKQGEEPTEEKLAELVNNSIAEVAGHLRWLNMAGQAASQGDESHVELYLKKFVEAVKQSKANIQYDDSMLNQIRLGAFLARNAKNVRNYDELMDAVEEARKRAAELQIPFDEATARRNAAGTALDALLDEIKGDIDGGKYFPVNHNFQHEMGVYGVHAEDARKILDNVDLDGDYKNAYDHDLRLCAFEAHKRKANYLLRKIAENTSLGHTRRNVSEIEENLEKAKNSGETLDELDMARFVPDLLKEKNDKGEVEKQYWQWVLFREKPRIDCTPLVYNAFAHWVVADLSSVMPFAVKREGIADKIREDYASATRYADKAYFQSGEGDTREKFNNDLSGIMEVVEQRLYQGVRDLAESHDSRFEKAFDEYAKLCEIFPELGETEQDVEETRESLTRIYNGG